MANEITPEQIAEILDNKVPDIIELMGDLDLDSMRSLVEQEQSGKNRGGLMEPALKRLAELQQAALADENTPPESPEEDSADMDVTPPDEGAEVEPTAKQARGEELPEWKRPDYSGGLTVEQALWRGKHIITK